MTCVPDMEAGERGGAGDSSPAAWDLSDLWRLPFALMLVLFRAFFRRKLDWLREQRRTRPQPKNWRDHVEGLHLAEWSVIEVSEAGLAQLLAGKELNLHGILPRDPPDDWHWPCPRSAFEMHRRIEALIAFNADPEGRIRRMARRLEQEKDADPPLDDDQPATAIVQPIVQLEPCFAARIRAPPRRNDWKA